MITANIRLGQGINMDPSASINNVFIGDDVKIGKFCSIYGSEKFQAEIGENSIISMFTIINGYADKLIIGKNCSIGHYVFIMTDSGPSASPELLKVYPIITGPVTIENDVWIGAHCVILPNVRIGAFSIVAANSMVTKDIEPYSMYGGSPAKFIKKVVI